MRINEVGEPGDMFVSVDGPFIPVGDLMRQLVLALGAALIVGSIAVVVRERLRKPGDVRPTPSWGVVVLNLVVGLVLTLWGVSSIFQSG